MLQITKVDEPVINSIAPTIYIDSIDYDTINTTFTGSVNKYKVYFSFVDDEAAWIKNDNIINSLNVNFSYFDSSSNKTITLFEDSLANVKNKGFYNNNSIQSYCEFYEPDNILGDFIISASCGNNFLIGDTAVEKIKNNIVFYSASINNSNNILNFPYISKIRDFSLLKLPDTSFSASLPTEKTGSISDLNVSYTTNKTALLGTIINLEKILEQNSRPFNYFKNYPFFKEQILKNSNILTEKTYFSKKNVSLKQNYYNKIENTLDILKFDDASSYYYITTADTVVEPSDKSKYNVKLNLVIQDYSYIFYKNLKQNFSSIKSTITSLKLLFADNIKNKKDLNINEFIFTTFFSEELINKIESAINNLIPIIIFANPLALRDEVITLLVNCFHPLFTSLNTLNRLEDYIKKIETTIVSFFKDSSVFVSDQAIDKLSFIEIEKKFEFVDSTGKLNNVSIDYSFEKNYGYEIISTDSFDVRSTETNNSIKQYPSEYLSSRRILEMNKFFSRYSSAAASTLNFFTLTQLDLGKNNYDLVLNELSVDIAKINEIYFRILEYNNYNFSFDIYESSFFQLANNNFFVKTLSNKNNISVNNLQKTTIFDPNLDSKQQSLEFITSTGIYDLVKFLDETVYKKVSKSIENSSIEIPQYFASSTADSAYGSSKFVLPNNLEINNLKGKAIIYYNTIFYNKLVISGSNYSLYELEEVNISEIFNKKLKLFNKFYIIFNKNPIIPTENNFIPLKEALKFSYLPKYINRKTIPATFNFSTQLL